MKIGMYRRKIIFGFKRYNKNMTQTFFTFIKQVGVVTACAMTISYMIKVLKGKGKKPRQTMFIKVTDIEGAFDHRSLEELLREDDQYKWSELLLDIERHGVCYPISVCRFGDTCHPSRKPSNNKKYSCLAGNHRVKILQILDTGNMTIEAKCDKIPCRTVWTKFYKATNDVEGT
jgi:hypothetical protein